MATSPERTPPKKEDEYTTEVRKIVPMLGQPGSNIHIRRVADQFERSMREVVEYAMKLKAQAPPQD